MNNNDINFGKEITYKDKTWLILETIKDDLFVVVEKDIPLPAPLMLLYLCPEEQKVSPQYNTNEERSGTVPGEL